MNDRKELEAFIRLQERIAGEKAREVQYMQKCLARRMKELSNTMIVLREAKEMLRDMKPKLTLIETKQ